MKLTIIACVIFLFNCDVVRSHSGKEWEKMVDDCTKKEKINDSDMSMWKNHVKPKTTGVKCLDACLAEKLGMMANNKMNVDAMMKFIDTEIKDEKKAADYKAIIDECKSITDSERCEASAKIVDCLDDEARKRGIKELF